MRIKQERSLQNTVYKGRMKVDAVDEAYKMKLIQYMTENMYKKRKRDDERNKKNDNLKT